MRNTLTIAHPPINGLGMLCRIEVKHINVGCFACRYSNQLPWMLFPQSLDSLRIQGRVVKAVRAGGRLAYLALQTDRGTKPHGKNREAL
jgi:hypothetical protein